MQCQTAVVVELFWFLLEHRPAPMYTCTMGAVVGER